MPTIEEFIIEGVDAKELASKEESTSLEPKEMIKEVEKTIPKMTPWSYMHETISKVIEYIIQLNEEMEATIMSQKKGNF